jgi:hypothetical protein
MQPASARADSVTIQLRQSQNIASWINQSNNSSEGEIAMSTYYFIKSKLDGNVIDIQGASTTSGAPLDAYPQKTTGTDNQLWEFVPDPAGSGYYFIKSKLDGNVIDIKGASTASGTLLDAYPQKATGTDNQLWEFFLDPAGSGYHFIVSKMNGNVIDVQGASTKAGALLDAYPLKSSGTDNQLWTVVGGSFPASVSAVPAPGSGLGSNSNYIFDDSCKNLTGLSITIDVTENIVCKSASGSTTGFGFQLNCYSPKKETSAWQQYVVAVFGTEIIGAVDNWPVTGNNIINDFFNLTSTPNNEIPAGYQVKISLQNDSKDNISGATYVIIDNTGKTLANVPLVLTSISGVTTTDLAPIVAFELNLVGPVNGESAVLSSGAGTFTYTASNTLTVLNAEPSCTESGYITAETANSVYSLLPASPNNTFKQSFNTTTAAAMIHKQGKLRPSTRR